MPIVEERVDRLEIVLEEYIRAVGDSQRQTEAELREFKDEMREFKKTMEIKSTELYNSQRQTEAELREFKDEMSEFKDEMSEFKHRMEVSNDKMDKVIEEIKEESKRKNREWGNLANKMGTIVEDLIAPALRPVLSKYFSCDVKTEGQRMFKRKDGEDYEIDAIAVSDNKVFMIEARSTPTDKFVDDIAEKGNRFFEFYPEYKDKRLVVILGSITFPENVIKYASRKGIYVMGWREWEYMDILNFNEVFKLEGV